MSVKTLEQRVEELETKMERLTGPPLGPAEEGEPWWRRIAGRFKGNQEFEEAMRLGREYRASQRPSGDEVQGD